MKPIQVLKLLSFLALINQVPSPLSGSPAARLLTSRMLLPVFYSFLHHHSLSLLSGRYSSYTTGSTPAARLASILLLVVAPFLRATSTYRLALY